MTKRYLLLLCSLLTVLNSIPLDRATAQTFTILHRFDGSDGSGPWGNLILSDNTLYGTAVSGGSAGNGTAFKINTDGTGFTNLHSFTATSDGADLEASLILSGSSLYGAAAYGGSFALGTLFAVGTNGTGFRMLHTFTGYPRDGANPRASLVLTNNTLYGTTAGGGSSDIGIVFAINIDGTGFKILHSFTAGAYDNNGYYTNSDGVSPWSGLFVSGNTLYGTAVAGGSSGNGTVFSVNTDGSAFTNLHSFSAGFGTSGEYGANSDGINPWAGLTLSGNTLYTPPRAAAFQETALCSKLILTARLLPRCLISPAATGPLHTEV
jgi:uncharacterized repeat protein (TIGR03803 family)